MLSGRPLYDTEADARFFRVPELWNTLSRAVDHENNVLVWGERGGGKTTLLRQLQATLRRQDEPVVYVDATAVATAESLAAGISAQVRPAGSLLSKVQYSAQSNTLLGALDAIAHAEATTVLVDASNAAEAVHGLFGRMRDALWRMPHRWVVAVDDTDRFVALRPPADAFFDTVLQLEPLSINAIVELLDRREAGLDPSAIAEIAANAKGNPRLALRAANSFVVSGGRPSAALSERAHLLEAAARLGRPQGLLMAELLDLGQAGPSDTTLQDRLGLTRSRLTTLFRTLLENELVEVGTDAVEGVGRPKTIYRPKLEDA